MLIDDGDVDGDPPAMREPLMQLRRNVTAQRAAHKDQVGIAQWVRVHELQSPRRAHHRTPGQIMVGPRASECGGHRMHAEYIAGRRLAVQHTGPAHY